MPTNSPGWGPAVAEATAILGHARVKSLSSAKEGPPTKKRWNPDWPEETKKELVGLQEELKDNLVELVTAKRSWDKNIAGSDELLVCLDKVDEILARAEAVAWKL